jgi:hypothetical protein
MANKRLSDLSELVAANLQPDDLFYVVDVSTTVLEGKKIKVSSIQDFILNGGQITGSITYALTAGTASYVNPSLLAGIVSASYARSASRAERSFFAQLSDTASYVDASNIYGTFPSSSMSNSASFVIYRYGNGTVENSKTASYVVNSLSSSYVVYTGVKNGTVFQSVSSSYVVSSSLAQAALFLNYNGTPNGTASYATSASVATSASYMMSASYGLSASFADNCQAAIVSNFSNYLNLYGPTIPNGTASCAISASQALIADSSSFLIYNGVTPNGTASYTPSSSVATSASYAYSSSRSENTQRAVSASYALSASYPLLDPNQYKVYGPFNSTDGTYGGQTSTELSYRNFIINPTGVTTTILVQAVCDVKVPITTTDSDGYSISLLVEDWTNNVLLGTFTLDTSRPNNFITGAVVAGYTRQATTLMGGNTSIQSISGSWYTLRVKATGGAEFDGNSQARGAQFFIYVKPDTALTRTTYPPF